MTIGAIHTRRRRIDDALCRRVRALVRVHGQVQTMDILNVGIDTLQELRLDGSLLPATIARVVARLEEYESQSDQAVDR